MCQITSAVCREHVYQGGASQHRKWHSILFRLVIGATYEQFQNLHLLTLFHNLEHFANALLTNRLQPQDSSATSLSKSVVATRFNVWLAQRICLGRNDDSIVTMTSHQHQQTQLCNRHHHHHHHHHFYSSLCLLYLGIQQRL